VFIKSVCLIHLLNFETVSDGFSQPDEANVHETLTCNDVLDNSQTS